MNIEWQVLVLTAVLKMKIFIVIFGSAFVEEIIQAKYSILDAVDYCQV